MVRRPNSAPHQRHEREFRREHVPLSIRNGPAYSFGRTLTRPGSELTYSAMLRHPTSGQATKRRLWCVYLGL